MTEEEKQARRIAVAAIAKLSYAYGKEMPDEQIDIYITALHDLSDKLDKAVDIIISTERYFPSVATIRSVALRDDDRLTPEEAWSFVVRMIQSEGRNGRVRGLRDEIKAAVEACGGYQALCASERFDADRFTFIRAYKTHTERSDRQAAEAWIVPKELKSAVAQIGRAELL
jgi:hypothetical protein